MINMFSKKVFYLVVVFLIILSSVGSALWVLAPDSVRAEPGPTPTPVALPAPVPTPLSPTVAIIAPKSPEGEMGMKMGYEWAANNGLRVIAEQWYPPGDFNQIEGMVIKLFEAKSGHIYIGGANEKESYFIQELLKKLGYQGKVVVGPTGVALRAPQTTHVNMGWKEAGPVFGTKTAPPYQTVVQLSPAMFAMWYWTGSGVNWATSNNGTEWSDRGAINVTGAIPAGYQLGIPSVVFWREVVGVVAQEHFLMYVSAFINIGSTRHWDYILVLQSSDGLNWSYLGNAFADSNPGSDPAGNLTSLTVIKKDTGYEGWLCQGGGIYYTTSADGVAWSTPQPATGLPNTFHPTVVPLAGKYVMWYGYGLSEGESPVTAIGMAFSDDGVNWTPSPENPLYRLKPDSWRSERTYAPWVVLDQWNGIWRMWFTGGTSSLKGNTEFLTLDPSSPTDTPAIGRFSHGVSDPNSIVIQLRFPSPSNPLEGINSISDDEGNSYTATSREPGGKIIIGGWDSLNGGSKPASTETLTVRYSQRIREYRIGYTQAPTHILQDVVQKSSWGDEIIVHPGVYLGQVYAEKAMRLRSSHGAAVTIIDAQQEQRYTTPAGSHPAAWVKVEEGPWGTLPDWWWQKFGVPETRIEGFTISNSYGAGIVCSLLPGDRAKLNPRGRIVNNVVRNIAGTGIAAVSSSNNMRIENNQVYGNSGAGIIVTTSAWVGLFNNSIHNNGQQGFLLLVKGGGWAYSHVQGNEIVANGAAGIRSEMNDGFFTNNVVSGNGGSGIRLLTQAQPTLKGNTISSNGGDGLWVQSGAASVQGNIIGENGGHGITLAGADGSRVAGNTIINNGIDGIHANNSGNLISANQITNNKHGIWVEGDNNRILANNINNNVASASGVHLTASAENNQVHYNNFSGNVSFGVFKETAPPVDATNNWWGIASGPSGTGPGSGDAVNEYVNFTPWLTAAFSDNTPPVVAETLSLPRSIAIYSMTGDNKEGTTIGPTFTTFLARANDEHSGVVNAELNIRPLAEMLTADLQIPPERQSEWQGWLQSLEHWQGMWFDGVNWGKKFELSWLAGDIIKRFSNWGMGEMAMAILFKLHTGDTQVIATIYDGAGNHAAASIPLTIVGYMLPLSEGWNLRSLPFAIGDDVWSHIKSLGDGLSSDVALRFNDSTQQWQLLTDTDRWKPLDGIYIHATERDQLNLTINNAPTAPPTRDLSAGWSLVGFAPPIESMDMPVTSVLRSLDVNTSGQRGYLVATSPAQGTAYRQEYRYTLPDGNWRSYGSYDWRFGQEPWVYLAGDEYRGQMMTLGGGNWVYMEHPDTLVGFSGTPIVSSEQPGTASALPRPVLAATSSPPPLPMVLKVSASNNWTQIEAMVDGQIIAKVRASDAQHLLLVQGDIPNGTGITLYVDGKIADQRPAYEGGAVASIALTMRALAADVNADSIVNHQDLAAAAANFNTRVQAGNPADINKDGVVDIFDLAWIARFYGKSVQ